MEIKRLYEEREKLDEQMSEIDRLISERWAKLIGFGCGYFSSWRIDGESVVVTYERAGRQGGGLDHDVISLACFEAEDIETAKSIWNAETFRRRTEEAERERISREKKDREQYERLKGKYETR